LGVTAILGFSLKYLKAGNATLNSDYIGRDYWRDTEEYKRMLKAGSFKGSSLVLVGASHVLQPKYPTLLDLPYKR
jgi:hypothetical protein